MSAVDETNSLLVRASPAAWKSIRDVIERLDVMPMQVHIEAQVVEVAAAAATLQYGVNWYFEQRGYRSDAAGGGAGPAERDAGAATSGAILAGSVRRRQHLAWRWTFLGRNAAAVDQRAGQGHRRAHCCRRRR